MNEDQAVSALSALAHTQRLRVFRALVVAGPEGLTPGALGESLALPATGLSFHLKELTAAGLIEGESRGRYICYRANFAAMNDLIGFLTRNCCGGDASRCAPAKQASASKATPVKKVPVKKAIRT